MQVYINKKNNPKERVLVEVELVKEREHTLLVRLPDGTIIVRKKKRDLLEEKV
jgi:hypothetical protein